MIEVQGYTIVGQIGKGGMATVYRARQVLLDREVALKVMSPQLATDPVYAQRFQQEARMLAALNHPNIVQVFDIGETPTGLSYFSMQLLTGGDFGSRLSDGMSEAELVRVLAAVAQALSFAHARGYVHRDVTPANILFDAHDQPVLTDFGIARALAATSRITSAGLSIGTSQYMSPEQARGVEVDHRSDIYSLGVLAFEAVVGHPPFQGDDGFAVAFSHVHDPVPRLPEEALRWQSLIDRAMAKDPAERFPDCAAFIDALAETAPGEYADAVGPLPAGALPAPAVPAPAAPAKATRPAPAKAAPAAAVAPRVPLQDSGETLPARWIPLALAAGAVVCGILLALGLWQWVSTDEPPARPATRGALPATAGGAPARATPAVRAGESRIDPVAEEPIEEQILLDPVALAEQGEPLPVLTVQDPVAQLLGLAAANIRAQRYTTPPTTNALDRYRLALLIEPDNRDALQGIARVAGIYLEIANGLDREQELDAWLENLAKAEEVAGESSAGTEILASIRSLREAHFEQLLRRAREAVGNWNRSAALAALDAAAKIDPSSAALRAERQRAEQVGMVGYIFTDAPALPEMIVVGERLALARNEVTVGEYKRYWEQAGKARFERSLPTCRNREGIALFSRRNFEAPDITQDGSHPVVCLSFEMAEHYAAHIAERSGKPYRLPRADELAGLLTTSADCASNVRDAAYGNKFSARDALSCNDGHAETAPVRSYPPSTPGLFDLDGNVSEWTSDCADSRCSERLVLGRSWELESGRDARRGFPADTASNTIGLRLARDLPVRDPAAP